MTQKNTADMAILIATGASGGHMFPALSVAKNLRARGVKCVFVVGGGKFTNLVEDAGFDMVWLPASALNVRNPLRKLKGIFNLLRAFWRALRLVQTYQPAAVFGTGGYATVALVLAGKISGVPTIIHEQNVLPGRANKFLARWADKILLTFAAASEHLNAPTENLLTTGYPLRERVAKAVAQPKARAEKPLRLLVLGGSQGSRILSQVLPEAVARLPESIRQNLFIQHQARAEDANLVTEEYAKLDLVGTDLAPFIDDIPAALTAAHVVISRAGTGAVVEISVFGRAAIYVPLSLADGHQAKNARLPEKANAAVVLDEPLFTPEALAAHLLRLLENPDIRYAMEDNAKNFLPLNGTKNVADAVLDMAKSDIMMQQE